MTATGNPRAALTACVQALAPLASNVDRAAAADMAQEALRGSPYPGASLETAACLWEAVLDFEREADDDDATDEGKRRGSLIRAAREAIGSAALRLSVLSWVDAVDAAWLAADTGNGAFPGGGQYDDAFDWAFVPNWIAENVDWDGPNAPTLRAPAPAASAPAPSLTTWVIPVEASFSLHVTAQYEHEARAAARRFIEETAPNEGTADGWNSAQDSAVRIATPGLTHIEPIDTDCVFIAD